MTYIDLPRISKNTYLSVTLILKVIESFNLLTKGGRLRGGGKSVKLVASELHIVVLCDFLYQEGFTMHEISRVSKKNLKRLVEAVQLHTKMNRK